MKQIVNLTPHAITFQVGEKRIVFPPAGQVARAAEVRIDDESVDGIPVSRVSYGAVENLPEPKPGIIFVVSALVRAAVPLRKDVMSPDTGPGAVRENGQIVAVRGLLGN